MQLTRYYVYILASKKDGTLYIGMTNDLRRRLIQHRLGTKSSFTRKYHIRKLVYYEVFRDVNNAIQREKQLKKWNRQWKIRLIEENNLEWEDLGEGIAE